MPLPEPWVAEVYTLLYDMSTPFARSRTIDRYVVAHCTSPRS